MPNVKVLREFLIHKGKFYTPPIKDLTNKFCRVILFISLISNSVVNTQRREKIVEKS